MTAAWWRSTVAPWAGLIAAAFAAMLDQQLPGDVLYYDCTRGGGPVGAVVGAIALIVAIVGGVVSWRARPAVAETREDKARRLISELSAMAAGLAAVFIVFLSLAALIVPPCQR